VMYSKTKLSMTRKHTFSIRLRVGILQAHEMPYLRCIE